MSTATHAPASPAPASRALTDSVTMLRRNLLHARRYPALTFSVIILPVILLLLFRFVFGGALGKATGVPYADYIVPGMMLMIPAYLVTGVAVAVATDMTKGIVNRFRAMPMSHPAILTGQVAGTLIQGLLGTGLMVAVGVATGFRSHASVLEWLAAFGLIALAIVALAWLGAGFGGLHPGGRGQRADAHPVPAHAGQRAGADRHHARRGAPVRRVSAVHPDDPDAARPAERHPDR
jgi:uncharacterized membrane protein